MTIKKTSVNVLSIMPEGILLSVFDKDYFVSFNRLPWFRNAKESDIMNVSLCGRDGIRWEALDVDLEIESLIHPEKYPLLMKQQHDTSWHNSAHDFRRRLQGSILRQSL